MRDLFVLLIVFGSIPMIFKRPWLGIIVWSWLGYMNPHRLTWSFAYDFPFAQVIGIVTLIAFLLDTEKKRFPVNAPSIIWLVWIVWMNVTTVFSLVPELAWDEWDRTMKIQLFTLLTVLLIRDKFRINVLVWTIAVSLGFYGVKGGIFSILTGGQYHVFGPPGSFFEGNNGLGVALTMTLPLLWYLYTHSKARWQRLGLLASIPLVALAIVTTQSRGAALAVGAMLGFLWLKSRHKVWLGLALIVIVPVILVLMPEAWFERMGTISNYEEDGSAMGRINAWWFAFNLAKDYPITGGGFQVFTPELFHTYAPTPEDFHDSHSIYFEVLGEQGFVGLVIFLAYGLSLMFLGGWVIRKANGIPELLWARDLAAMLQVSLVGYAVGGLFVGLAYFDLLYHVGGLLMLLHRNVVDHLEGREATTDTPAQRTGRRRRPGRQRPRIGAPAGPDRSAR